MEPTTEYLFSINTGRSGSHYLASLFEHVSDCRAFHEPEPIGNGEVMRRYARGDVSAMRRFTEQKVEAIRASKGDSRTYVETNHCFIKGFGWFIPEYLPEGNIGVIILKRDKVKVAESILRIGYSPLNGQGREWISTPEMQSPIVPPPKRSLSPKTTYNCARFASFLIRRTKRLKRSAAETSIQYPKWMVDYEMECLKWYVEETEAKAEAFRKKYPRIKYYETNVEELNSIDSVRQMLSHFGLSEDEPFKDVVGKPTNLKLPKNS
jgi:hypothetical protein